MHQTCHRCGSSVILSTLPPGPSRWLGMDLPHRVERRFGVPVTHVVDRASALT
jgi:hypothetical protein